MGKHEIVKEQLLHIVLIPFRKSGWENYSLSESNYMTSVLIPFRKSGWENAESSWPMRSVVCLNPLQEIGVGKQYLLETLLCLACAGHYLRKIVDGVRATAKVFHFLVFFFLIQPTAPLLVANPCFFQVRLHSLL